jgi:Integral membrane protein S linking to the trans Golgi network
MSNTGRRIKGEASFNEALSPNSAPTSLTSMASNGAPRSRRTTTTTTAAARRPDEKKDFNPRLISSQIIAMQCFHYVFLGLLFQINNLLYGTSITIDRIFTDHYIRMWSWKGLPDTFAVLISSIVG